MYAWFHPRSDTGEAITSASRGPPTIWNIGHKLQFFLSTGRSWMLGIFSHLFYTSPREGTMACERLPARTLPVFGGLQPGAIPCQCLHSDKTETNSFCGPLKSECWIYVSIFSFLPLEKPGGGNSLPIVLWCALRMDCDE